MPRPFKRVYTPSDPDTDGLVDGGSGASLTLLASGAGDGLAHQLNFTSSADISDHTFTVVGTDENGMAQTEVVTGPNNTTVESASYFLTVTSITPNATLGSDEVDIGWVDEFVTPTFALNRYSDDVAIRVDVGGTINYTAQKTFDSMRIANDGDAFTWSDVDDPAGNIDMSDITASVEWAFDPIPTGMRLQANSYSSGATLTLYVVHQG